MELNKFEGFCELDNTEMYYIEGGDYLSALKVAAKFGKVGLIVFCAGVVAGAVYEAVLGE